MLLAQTALCPFVYFGQHLRTQAGQSMYTSGQAQSYVLWHQIAGSTVLRRSGQSWTLRPLQVFLAEPGIRAGWRSPAHVQRVIFDLVGRQRRRKSGPGDESWIPADASVQPDWETLFGGPAQPLLPSPWSSRARNLIAALIDNWWNTPRQQVLNGLHLGQLLVEYASHLSTEPVYQPPQTVAAVAGELRDSRLVREAEFILHAPDQLGITMDELAARLGITRNYLTLIFRRIRGFGPKSVQQRIRRAAGWRLRAEGFDLPAIATALSCSIVTVRRFLR